VTRGPTSDRARQGFIGSYAFGIAAAVFNQGGTFLGNLLVARVVGVDQFGAFTVVQVTALSLATIMQLSLWLTTTHFMAQSIALDAERAGRTIATLQLVARVLATISVLVVLAGSGWYSAAVFEDPALQVALIAASGAVAGSILYSHQAGALVGLQAFRQHALAALVPGVVQLASVFVGAKLYGYVGALVGLSFGAVVRCVFAGWALRAALRTRDIPKRRPDVRAMWRELVAFAAPASANALTYAGAAWAASGIIVQQHGMAGFALYAACLNIRTMVMFVPLQANTVSVALLSRLSVAADQATFRRGFWSNLGMLVLTSALFALIISFFSVELLGLYGREFVNGRDLLITLMIGCAFEAAGYGITQSYSSRGRMWTMFFLGALPRDITFLCVLFYLSKSYGLAAAGWAFVISWTAYLLMLGVNLRAGREATS
jgi:O-antigen/teichoic acid export membrane protein